MNKEIKIAGKRIFYRVYGSGKPVMLVHGFGETGEVWENKDWPPQSPPKEGLTKFQINLSDKFMFIIPDLPGSGKSEMVPDMSMQGMAEVVKTILDEENNKLSGSQIPPSGAVLIGHSMGGYITLAFAEKYQSDLSAFGLFHSTAYADTEEKKETRRKGIEFIKQHGAFEFLKTSTPNLFSPHTKERSPELVNDFIQSLAGFKSEPLIAYYEAMIHRPDRIAVLKNSNVPVLFVMGEHDVAAPMQDVLKQCHLPSRSFIHILHQSGHLGMLEQPEKSNRLLTEFLANV